mmetsp:Transcript_56171/g.132353  ORF Transcript_56171/g.132353 Transcript_56171/m.132353 type:complete len:101 (-) Transcript_56171:295-597(-)
MLAIRSVSRTALLRTAPAVTRFASSVQSKEKVGEEMIKYPCGRILALVIDEEGNAKTARQEKVKNRCLECVAFGGTQPIKCSAAHQVAHHCAAEPMHWMR